MPANERVINKGLDPGNFQVNNYLSSELQVLIQISMILKPLLLFVVFR